VIYRFDIPLEFLAGAALTQEAPQTGSVLLRCCASWQNETRQCNCLPRPPPDCASWRAHTVRKCQRRKM